MCNPLLDSSKISRDWSFCCSSQFFKIIISSDEMPFHCSTRKLWVRGLLVCSAQKWTWWWCWRMLGFDCKRKVIWLLFTMSFSSYFAFWSHIQVNGFFFYFRGLLDLELVVLQFLLKAGRLLNPMHRTKGNGRWVGFGSSISRFANVLSRFAFVLG